MSSLECVLAMPKVQYTVCAHVFDQDLVFLLWGTPWFLIIDLQPTQKSKSDNEKQTCKVFPYSVISNCARKESLNGNCVESS